MPSGIRVNLAALAYDPSNRYRFNGKEEQVTGNVGLTDYGARFYDSSVIRWTTPDPLAEKYYSTSPYAFCNSNPVNFVDLDGKAIDIIADVISIGCGIYNLAQNIKAGNTKAAWGALQE
ncbi:MAG: RHS repeat-associated core domain-containing protein [Bacteroidales bacterium]|nr:RHS repeat-associated core domain-containing protein [Bacteroidales bacterium]